VITDPQIGPRDLQIVTVQIRPAPHFVACRIYLGHLGQRGEGHVDSSICC